MTAPVIQRVDPAATLASNIFCTIVLSDLGTGGTGLRYAQTVEAVKPTSFLLNTPSFQQVRGTRRYYWASRDNGGPLTSAPFEFLCPFVEPDLTITVFISPSSPLPPTSTSEYSIAIGNSDSTSNYQIRLESYSGTQLVALFGASFTPLPNAYRVVPHVPGIGNTTRYYITATRAIAQGGSGNIHNVTFFDLFHRDYDRTPNPVTFTNVTLAELSTVTESNIVTITGIEIPVDVSITQSGFEYRINGGTWVSTTQQISTGNTLQLRVTSSAAYATALTTNINVGASTFSWSVTTRDVYLPPVISSISYTNTATAAVDTSIVTSSLGTGGTGVNYNRTTENVRPTTWLTTNNFTNHTRGTTLYYWARREGVEAYSTVFSFAPPYINPTAPTLSYPATIAPGATNYTLTLTNAQASTTYRVTQGGVELGFRIGNGDINISTVPPENASLTYVVQASRPTSIGGSGSYVTVTSYSVYKIPYDRMPDEVNLGSVAGAPLATFYESNLVTISGVEVPINVYAYEMTGPALDIISSSTYSSYSINGGAYVAGGTVGSATNGDTIRIRGRSDTFSYDKTLYYALFIGERRSPFPISTAAPRAPVISGFVDTGVFSNEATLNILFSDEGIGGNLEIGVSDNATTLPTTFQANIFTPPRVFQIRGTTKYYWARRGTATSSTSFEFYAPYIAPDTSITLLSSTISVNSNSHFAQISGADSYTEFTVFLGDSSLASNTGGGTFSVADNSAAGSTTTYTVVAKRSLANGGDNTSVTAGTYTVTRETYDVTPDPFSFTTITGAQLNTATQSASVTITGINGPATVSITGGTYSVNGGGAATTVNAGDTIRVTVTSAGTHDTLTTATITVGTVSSTFSVRTKLPSAPTIGSAANAGNASATETVTLTLSLNGSADTALKFVQSDSLTIPATGWQDSRVFSQARDTTRYYWASYNTNVSLFSERFSHYVGYLAPDSAITATPTSPITAVVLSHVVTVSDGDANTTYEVRSGSYGGTELASRVGNGAITVGDNSQPDTTTNYFITALRTTALGGNGARVNAVQYSVVRSPYVTTPDVFTFTDITNAQSNALYTSNEIAISGINTTVTVTVSGGSYRRFTGGAWGAYTTAQGQAVAGDKFQLRGTSSTVTGTTVDVVLTVGGRSDTWSITTSGSATDTTPDPLTFIGKVDAELSTIYTSNSQAVASINAQVIVSIAGGEYEKNGSGVWTTQNGTAVVNDTFRVRHTSSNLNSTTVTTTLTIGGIPSTFTTTTKALVATGVYGFEVYNASGNKILEVSSRVPRLVAAGTATITVGAAVGTYSSTALTVTGYSPTDDSWQVAITETGFFDSRLAYYYTGAANSVTFKIDRLEAVQSSATYTVYYYIVRN